MLCANDIILAILPPMEKESHALVTQQYAPGPGHAQAGRCTLRLTQKHFQSTSKVHAQVLRLSKFSQCSETLQPDPQLGVHGIQQGWQCVRAKPQANDMQFAAPGALLRHSRGSILIHLTCSHGAM